MNLEKVIVHSLSLLFFYLNSLFCNVGKYHKGKRVEGVWVFGGVERDTGKCFLVKVQDRSATTLIALIK